MPAVVAYQFTHGNGSHRQISKFFSEIAYKFRNIHFYSQICKNFDFLIQYTGLRI